MENTFENKQKFFAQYWGQDIMGMQNDLLPDFKVEHISKSIIKANWRLFLTPLSVISDKDAIELSNIYSEPKKIHSRILGRIIASRLSNNEVLDEPKNIIKIIDYLRSKSYALPWNGLPVEKQIAYGWVKLKME